MTSPTIIDQLRHIFKNNKQFDNDPQINLKIDPIFFENKMENFKTNLNSDKNPIILKLHEQLNEQISNNKNLERSLTIMQNICSQKDEEFSKVYNDLQFIQTTFKDTLNQKDEKTENTNKIINNVNDQLNKSKLDFYSKSIEHESEKQQLTNKIVDQHTTIESLQNEINNKSISLSNEQVKVF
jgi:multidrug resistance efflux pump